MTYEEIIELETYLKRKWGIVEGCKLPADTTGYNVSQCNTAGEAEGLLVESACNVVCDTGYKADNIVLKPAKVIVGLYSAPEEPAENESTDDPEESE